MSIGLRCLRWGFLLRATGSVKWRHAAEALITGFAANYILPGRIGEVFRVDYARRVFNMSRFISLGTIVVERVCDGIVLVCAFLLSGSFIVA
jgi:glycosyltransferase 2 family protein